MFQNESESRVAGRYITTGKVDDLTVVEGFTPNGGQGPVTLYHLPGQLDGRYFLAVYDDGAREIHPARWYSRKEVKR